MEVSHHSLQLVSYEIHESSVTNNVPPFLRLPVELRNIIYDHVINQKNWLPLDSKQAENLIIHPKLVRCADFQRREMPLVQRQKAFLTTTRTDTNEPFLTCAFPLSRINKKVRAEFSNFLRTVPMPVVTRVRDFDFTHVVHFLSTLGEARQDAFKVGLQGKAARTLMIELQSPYTVSCMERLQFWIEQVHSFVGPGKLAELATFHRTVPSPRYSPTPRCGLHHTHAEIPLSDQALEFWGHTAKTAPGSGSTEAHKISEKFQGRSHVDFIVHAPDHTEIPKDNVLRERVPIPVLLDAQEYYEQCAPGPGKIEARKIMLNLFWRFRVEYTTKRPEYDDILEAVQHKIWWSR